MQVVEKTTKQKSKISKKELILDVADRQISAGGLKSMSIRTIADELGGASSSMYYHFKDLDELVLRVNSRTIAILDGLLAEAAEAADGMGVAALFERLALAYLHFAIDRPMQFAALFEHRMTGDAPIPDWHMQEHYALFRHVEAPLASLDMPMSADERRVLARTIFSAVHGIVHLAMQGRLISLPVQEIEKQLRLITQVLASGLAGFAAARVA
ncbi:TetR/AcrR family transcriptional regulator [Rhizobium sp. BK176]|uniref:TetR/AcrR family transcriptional regulator n=1 Tax=Rhizobium sp. BK176 TaxID=2587071 RepID=UPI00216987C8|nr:TetR/AcrR family transcriptional regulator [Rhizobium sp. BK176]MCS4088725.1 AcrR family transcriptional regulator [Rhizobium sp. BK176]